MFVYCECCVLSGRGLRDGLIARPEESYLLLCVAAYAIETSSMKSQTSIVTKLTRSPRWRGPHHASESTVQVRLPASQPASQPAHQLMEYSVL